MIIRRKYPSEIAKPCIVVQGVEERFEIQTAYYAWPGVAAEGDTIFQWYWVEGSVFTPILGATESTYETTPEDLGKVLTLGVRFVDVNTNVWPEYFSNTIGPIAVGAFAAFDVVGTQTIMDVEIAEKVISTGGSPNRVADILDAAWLTANHWDDGGVTGAQLGSSPAELIFVDGTISIMSLNNNTNLELTPGGDITIIAVCSVDSTIGTSFMYFNYFAAAQNTYYDNNQLKINSSGTIISQAVAYADDAYRVHMWRSSSAGGFEWWVNNTLILSNPAHLYNWNINDFVWGRVSSFEYRGGLKKIQIIEGAISDTDKDALYTLYANSIP